MYPLARYRLQLMPVQHCPSVTEYDKADWFPDVRVPEALPRTMLHAHRLLLAGLHTRQPLVVLLLLRPLCFPLRPGQPYRPQNAPHPGTEPAGRRRSIHRHYKEHPPLSIRLQHRHGVGLHLCQWNECAHVVAGQTRPVAATWMAGQDRRDNALPPLLCPEHHDALEMCQQFRLSCLASYAQYGIQDFAIAGAAAYVATECNADLLYIWLWVLVQQFRCCH